MYQRPFTRGNFPDERYEEGINIHNREFGSDMPFNWKLSRKALLFARQLLRHTESPRKIKVPILIMASNGRSLPHFPSPFITRKRKILGSLRQTITRYIRWNWPGIIIYCFFFTLLSSMKMISVESRISWQFIGPWMFPSVLALSIFEDSCFIWKVVKPGQL